MPMRDRQKDKITVLQPRKNQAVFAQSTCFKQVMQLIILTLICLNSSCASPPEFEVKGFDVSHHQGKIDWKKIPTQQYQFVYLKATEGGDYVDPRFADNWLAAHEHGFAVGAYHFYNLCRDAELQSQNFIHTVPKTPHMLPPVIDLEYDTRCIEQRTQQQHLAQIKIMHDQLLHHYGQAPIFYTTAKFYHIVLLGHFNQTPLWIRDYQARPQLQDRQWTFWQYSRQGKIKGINGAVDLNVFYADQDTWQQFIQH